MQARRKGKGDGNGNAFFFTGQSAAGAEYFLMAAVHPVKGADGKEGRS